METLVQIVNTPTHQERKGLFSLYVNNFYDMYFEMHTSFNLYFMQSLIENMHLKTCIQLSLLQVTFRYLNFSLL